LILAMAMAMVIAMAMPMPMPSIPFLFYCIFCEFVCIAQWVGVSASLFQKIENSLKIHSQNIISNNFLYDLYNS
jgi:hypothetical protein